MAAFNQRKPTQVASLAGNDQENVSDGPTQQMKSHFITKNDIYSHKSYKRESYFFKKNSKYKIHITI